jgi:hypothetical protein
MWPHYRYYQNHHYLQSHYRYHQSHFLQEYASSPVLQELLHFAV